MNLKRLQLNFLRKLLFSFAIICYTNYGYAGVVSCGSSERTASLDSAQQCIIGQGNATAATIDAEYPRAPDSWTIRGDVAGSNGTDDLFTVNVTSGDWDEGQASGTWDIDSSFWTIYGEAAISMHVGNGGGDPDHWSWLITHGETSGTWSYEKLSGGGGGLSNLHLYGVGEPVTIPDPIPEPESMILTLLTLSMISLRRH